VTAQSKSLGSGPVADVVLSNDGLTVYASFDDGYVRAYDIRTGGLTHAWHVGTDLGAIDLSPDGSSLSIVEDHILGTAPDPNWGTSYIVGAYTLNVGSGAVNSFIHHGTQYEYSFFDVGFLNNNSLLLTQRTWPGYSAFVPLWELNLATGAFSGATGTTQDSWLSPGAGGASVFIGEANISDARTDLFRSTGQYISRGNYQDNITGANNGAQAYNEAAGLAMQVVGQHAYVFNDSLQLVKAILLDTDVMAAAFNAAGTHLYLFENGTHSLVEYATSDWSIVQTIDAGSAFDVSAGHYASQLIVAPQEDYFILQADSGLVVLGNPAAPTDGTGGPDSLSGTLLDDTLNGLGGNDIVSGYAGADHLSGGDGNDLLDGGGGNDSLDGGADDDALKVSGIGNATAAGGSGSDRLVIDWSDSATAIVSTSPTGTTLDGYSGSIGDGGTRSVDFSGIESFDISTGSGDDVVRTGGGDDVVRLGAGNDTADGGAGIDGVSADLSAAATPIVWNLDTNAYSGPIGNFTNFEYFTGLTAGTGDDRITTSTLALDDLVLGGAGADVITVYAGHDAVNGGAGNNRLVIDYSAATGSVTSSGFQPGSGGGAGWRGTVSDGGSHGVAFDNIERLDITTGSGDDVVYGAGGADSIHTGLGTDALAGGDGDDLLDGGAGADHMIGGTGNDVFYVDDLGDVVTENAGEGTADEVRTALTGYTLPANVEILTWTGAGAGDVRGNSADNILAGGGAGDFFRLQDGGNDNASGGGGNDAFYFGSAYTAGDSVDGGSGSDQVALQGDYSGGVTLGTLTGVETLVAMTHSDARFGGGSASLFSYNIVAPDSTVAAGTQLLVNASTLQAGENLTFDGSAETNGSFFIYGGKGVDTLTGGSGADVFFFAEDGRFAATDHIDGGAGQDVMVLRGNYSLTLSGTSIVNVETVVLNSGSDARFYAAGTPFSYDITTADDTVAAGQTMTFNGGALSAAETLHFDGSAETNGNFRLFGGSADDVIKGGAGNDLIYGGLGHDDLTGGAGADTFRYQGAGESTASASDHILDFASGDIIDLGRIDAVTGGNDDAFHIVGAFDGQAGELVLTQGANNVWTVSGDTDGNGQADFQILVTVSDGHLLGSGDFVL
jgi:Ca2+-binding RTX toxin-like protein